MSASENKFLIVKPGVVLTPIIEPVIVAMDPVFEEANLKAFVTSGLRDAFDQLRIVKKYVRAKGLEYPALFNMGEDPNVKLGEFYFWQMAWSHLLNIGIIINPPLAAMCLLDYWRNGANKKGQIIKQTPHVTGKCFDIGGAGGEDSTINDELPVVKKCFEMKIPGLVNYLPEHNNNAIHVDCK